MEANALHDLTAAYALDALDAQEAREYEAHLARCERCRTELADLTETASALAYATATPAPPAELRARILQQAARERPNVVPLRQRWATTVAAVAAVAACAAIGLGIWAASLSSQLGDIDRQAQVAELLSLPGSRAIPFDRGTLVVTRTGDAALVLRELESAGSGFTYEAWVMEGARPRPAGLFDGGQLIAVPLEAPVRPGARVLVTKEREGGVAVPSRPPFISVQNRA